MNGNNGAAYGNANAPPVSPPRTRIAPSSSMNGTPKGPQPRRTGSEISLTASISTKNDALPPLPPHARPQPSSSSGSSTSSRVSGYRDSQATVRHAEPPAHTSVSLQLEEEDEEDYGELLDQQEELPNEDDDETGSSDGRRQGPYPPMAPQHDRHMSDLPDTAMLDSVVLPAIASVSLLLF